MRRLMTEECRAINNSVELAMDGLTRVLQRIMLGPRTHTRALSPMSSFCIMMILGEDDGGEA